jgi:ABC-type transport system substrate-binding protein
MGENKKHYLSRRVFLRLGTVGVAVGLVAACAPQTVEKIVKETVVVEKPVEKVVKETVIVAGTPQVVEKVVKETVVVAAAEGEKPSEVQELRVAAPTASAAALTTAQDNYSFPVSLLNVPMWTGDCARNPTKFGAVESWEEKPDKLGFIFHLRKGMKFSDGTPITAKEAAWSFGYHAMMAFPSFYGVRNNWGYFRQFGFMVKGAQPVLDGKITFAEFDAAPLEGVKVVDDFTLQVDFDKPYPFFLASTFGRLTMVKPESVQVGKTKQYAADAYWPTEKTAAFSGSWQLNSWTSGQGFSLVPNKNWYGTKPKLTKIIAQYAADVSTAIAAFKNKELDAVVLALSPAYLRQCKTDAYLKQCLVQFPTGNIKQLWITPYPPMDDVKVRRAIHMAIDKARLCDVMNAGDKYFTPIISHFAPQNAGCLDAKKTIKAVPFDPAKAKEELKASKYGDKVLDMEINITQGSPDDAIQKMLQDNLGLKNVKIRTEAMPDWTKPPYPCHLWPNQQGDQAQDSWFTLYNMVKTMMDRPAAPNETIPRVTAPYDPDFLTQCNKIRDEADMAKRCQYTAELYQMWNDRAYSIDMMTLEMGFLIAPWVKEFNVCKQLGAGAWPWLSPGVEATWIAKH